MSEGGSSGRNGASFDYVIVGGGTAGLLLANRLSACGKHTVLLLEAGSGNAYPWIHIPAGYLFCIDNPRTDWRLRTTPEPGLNGRSLLYPRGKTLGGCSSINGMIYMRGQARDYDHWAKLTGDDEWTWNRCLPDFIRHESHYSLDGAHDSSEWHGKNGEWRVERQRLHWELLDAVAEAAQEAGIPATADFNTGTNEGVGYFEVNQKRGWRWNTTKAFLKPALVRRNLTVWTEAQATSLRWMRDGHGSLRCSGVDVARGRERVPLPVQANREVLLTAGAIGSPHLLQLSGVGDPVRLRNAGLLVEHPLPGVGANLQDHLQLRTAWRVQGVSTLNGRYRTWWGRAAMALEYALWQRGPLSMAPSQLGVFTRSKPELAWPDLEFHVQPLTLPAFGQPLDRFPAFTASICHLNPSSRGTVTAQSPDPMMAPHIAPNYLATDDDRTTAVAALRLARHVVSQPALARYRPEEFKPGAELHTDEALLRAAGEVGTTIFHPVGTTRMGHADDPESVVDARLKVRGIAGLRVVDAGIMPTITSGNTASPVLMIAEKAARWILADA